MNYILITIVATIFVFGMIITSHELGHFIFAKLTGVTVQEFAIGMGPKLCSFQKGETLYTIRAFPIGGYNKLLGEHEKIDSERAFLSKSSARRLLVISAGALFNFITAFILFVLIAFGTGVVLQDIDSTVAGYPAKQAGIIKGDIVKSVNGTGISGWEEFTKAVEKSKGKPISITIERNNQAISKTLTPVYDKKEKRYMVGLLPKVEKYSLASSIKSGAKNFKKITLLIFEFFGDALQGKIKKDDIGGPIAIAKITGQAAQNGIWTVLLLAAFLSVNLGIMNLLPFPALDGGWIIIILFEAITRKKINEQKLAMINSIGFLFLLIIMILVTGNDISNLK